MIFIKPANIPGFPTVGIYKFRRGNWCLTDSARCDPIFIGSDCWFPSEAATRAALAPVRASHIPAHDGCVIRMKPRAAYGGCEPSIRRA